MIDLKALDAKLNVGDSDPCGTLGLDEERALLRALRETRIALREAEALLRHYDWDAPTGKRARTVLGGVSDE